MTTVLTPGDDLNKALDDQLRAAIREYSLESPWYGDEDERTLRDELHERDPWIRALDHAIKIAWEADRVAAGGSPLLLDWKASPATDALQAAYDQRVEKWLAGPEPILSQRLDPDELIWVTAKMQASSELADLGYQLRTTKKYNATVKAAATRAVGDMIAHKLTTEVQATAALGISRKTLRRWLGKDDAAERTRPVTNRSRLARGGTLDSQSTDDM